MTTVNCKRRENSWTWTHNDASPRSFQSILCWYTPYVIYFCRTYILSRTHLVSEKQKSYLSQRKHSMSFMLWLGYFRLWKNSPVPPNATTCSYELSRGFPPGCGDSVADFWGWDAHGAWLSCPDDVSGDMQEDEIPGGDLSLNILTTQTTVTTGIFPCKEKFPW